MRLSAVQLNKRSGIEHNRILTTNIFLNTGRCDRTGNRWLTGSLQQEHSHSWQQLANDDVLLVQLGVGVDVKVASWRLHCGAARSCGLQLRFTKTVKFGIRHCALTFLAHDEYQ